VAAWDQSGQTREGNSWPALLGTLLALDVAVLATAGVLGAGRGVAGFADVGLTVAGAAAAGLAAARLGAAGLLGAG